jgi:hypothetical protein
MQSYFFLSVSQVLSYDMPLLCLPFFFQKEIPDALQDLFL